MTITTTAAYPHQRARKSIFNSIMTGVRQKLSTAATSKKTSRSNCYCRHHSSATQQQQHQLRLCNLSMLIVAIFIFGSVPPTAPPIGLLSLSVVDEGDNNKMITATDTKYNSSLVSRKDLTSAVTVPTTASQQKTSPLRAVVVPNTTKTAGITKAKKASCFHEKTVEKDCAMTYLATFPGSGSELCLELIEGLTGIKTGHAYPFVVPNKNKNTTSTSGSSTTQKVVAMKTHYPNKILRGGNPKNNPVHVTRTILLLRHPMNAIPSFFNFLHEQKSRQHHHYFQAPLQEWIAWRDDDFSSKLYLWRFHMDYWLSQYHLLPTASSSLPIPLSSSSSSTTKNNDTMNNDSKKGNKTMILVAFEQLVHASQGPLVLQEMSQFLQENENVTTLPFSQIPCTWNQIVVARSANKRGDRGRRRRKTIDRYIPPFQNEQLQDMINMLQWQRDRYMEQYPQLGNLLNDYMKVAQDRLEKQQQQQDARNSSVIPR